MYSSGHDRLRVDADHATRQPCSGCARNLRVERRTLAQIVGLGVDDDRATDDRVWPVQLDHVVLQLELGLAPLEVDVAQVADVSLSVGRSAVRLAFGIEVTFGGLAVLSEVAERVYVESVTAFDAGQVAVDRDNVAMFLERDGALDGVGVAESADGAFDSNAIDVWLDCVADTGKRGTGEGRGSSRNEISMD